MYAVAIIYFVAIPSQGSLAHAFLRGVILGIVVYATYDLVNYATLKGWALQAAIVDVLWGGCITACASVAAVFCAKM